MPDKPNIFSIILVDMLILLKKEIYIGQTSLRTFKLKLTRTAPAYPMCCPFSRWAATGTADQCSWPSGNFVAPAPPSASVPP